MDHPKCSVCGVNDARFKGRNRDGQPRFRSSCDPCFADVTKGDVHMRIVRPIRFKPVILPVELGPIDTPVTVDTPLADSYRSAYPFSSRPIKIECIQAGCLDALIDMPRGKFNLVVTDLPYGTTGDKNDWNNLPLDLDDLWHQLARVLTPTGTVVMTAAMPYAYQVIRSNPSWFRYELVWHKNTRTKWVWNNYRPSCNHELVLIFSRGSLMTMKYNKCGYEADGKVMHPATILKIKSVKDRHHPTQKPIELFEWAVRTYSDEGDEVLDVCAGSGTTGMACYYSGRNCTLIEKFEPMYKIMMGRVQFDCPGAEIEEATCSKLLSA